MTQVAGWDRTFFDFSSRLADPFCWTLEGVYRLISPLDHKKFNNYSTPTQEFAYRVITTGTVVVGTLGLAAFAPFWTIAGVTTLGMGSKLCRVIAGILQKNNYTYVRGTFSEKSDLSELKVMTWNLLGLAGGLHYCCGGTVHWRDRIGGIVKEIKREKPDVLVLQEIFDTAFCEALIAKLKDEFAHFYCHLGTNSVGIGGGCMVLTKCPVKSFSNMQFKNSNWKLNRCFSIMEIGNSKHQYRIVGAHLQAGNAAEDATQRKVQFDQMINGISGLPPVTTILAGDLNMDRDTEGKYLEQHLTHGYTHEKKDMHE